VPLSGSDSLSERKLEAIRDKLARHRAEAKRWAVYRDGKTVFVGTLGKCRQQANYQAKRGPESAFEVDDAPALADGAEPAG
jgi:hypothetical protein